MTSVCDFCSTPKVIWCYPAEDFTAYTFGNLIGQSVGGWAACQDCWALIEADDRRGLAERSTALLIDTNPEMAEARSELIAKMSTLHGIFFANRTGAAVGV